VNVITRKLDLEKDGISGYLAYPDRKTRGPALLWIHHNHGVTDNLKTEAYDYAELGYTAFVPNLYHLLGHRGSHHLGKGQDIQKVTSDDKFVEVIRKSWNFLLARDDVNAERVGVIGYCMGGRLGIPFVAATPQVRAYVAFIRQSRMNQRRNCARVTPSRLQGKLKVRPWSCSAAKTI